MFKRSLLAASMLALCAAAPAQAAGPYSAIYSFGDSLSDVGNLFDYTGVPGNGPQQPAPPYANGQFSNGPVWNQDLAGLLGLAPLQPSIAGGTDYAWGGATTGFIPSPVPSLVQQVASATLVNPSSALFTISIGANDLFAILGAGGSLQAMQQEAAAAAAIVGSTAATLESEGARKLALFDVPDLGVTPQITQLNNPSAIAAASALSAFFDEQVLYDIAKDANGLRVYNINTYALIDEAVTNPGAFGFTNVTQPCQNGPYTGGGAVCATPGSYLFWDDLHPTEAGHAIIANLAFQEVTAVPEPASWALALIGFAGLGFAARRRPARALG